MKLQKLDRFAEFIVSFLDTKRGGTERGLQTAIRYKKALAVFEQFRGGAAVPFEPVAFNNYLAEYKEFLLSRYKPTTVSAHLVALRQFFKFMREQDPRVPEMKLKGMKSGGAFLRGSLGVEQIQSLVSFEIKNVVDARDNALIRLLACTGLRTVEAARALVGDVGQDRGRTVLRVQGKGRDDKDAVVLIKEDLRRHISAYLAMRQTTPEAPLFASHSTRKTTGNLSTKTIRKAVDKRLRAAGLKLDKISAHSLRHSAAHIALESGADLYAVKGMLRHKFIATTEIYLQGVNRFKNPAEDYIKI